ncbi:CBS domain-containing protein [Candidatus Woesearchaeota archaeon]|nr:CBS domain-containing protein [Candidatus Woesearchaeota archaeon]
MKTGYKVCDAMTRSPVSIDDNVTLEQCARMMEKNHVGALLVKDNGKLLGLLTEQDIVRKAIAKGMVPGRTKVKNIMVTRVKTIAPEKDIYDALTVMRNMNIRHLPVIDGTKMIGLLTLKDILKIQPQLFELMVEKFELREEENKPIFGEGEEGICESCGTKSKHLNEVKGTLLCSECILRK